MKKHINKPLLRLFYRKYKKRGLTCVAPLKKKRTLPDVEGLLELLFNVYRNFKEKSSFCQDFFSEIC